MNDTLNSPHGMPIDLAREGDRALGELAIRPSRLEVAGRGRRQILQPRVMQVLVALARADGEVVSRDELIASCWEGLAVGDDAINRCIGRLRRLAREFAGAPAFEIETIARVGYRLVASTDTGGTSAPGTHQPPARAPSFMAADGLSRIRAMLPRLSSPVIWAGILAVAATGAGAILVLTSQDAQDAVGDAAGPVVVAPFETRGGDPEIEVLAAGAADQIVAVLSASRVSAVRADRLGAVTAQKIVARGSVELDGSRWLVQARIDHGQEGVTLWSREFSRDRAERTALELEVAAKVSDAIAFALMCQPARRALESATLSLCVATAMLLRESDYPRALILGEELVSSAPALAFGHVLLASAALGATLVASDSERDALFQQAREEADRARALDPGMTDAHRILAAAQPTHLWAEREALMRQALSESGPALFRSNAEAALSRLYREAGFAREAAQRAQRAAELDPLSASKIVNAALALEVRGQIGDARALLNRSIEIWPSDWAVRFYQRRFELLYGAPEDAAAWLRDDAVPPLLPGARDAMRTFLDARAAGGTAGAADASSAIAAAVDSGALDAGLAVSALAQLGEIEAAFVLAERQLADDFVDTTFLFTPPTAPLRRDPRFVALAARAGLASYWRATNRWPDFCDAPDQPYDCSVAAQEAAPPGDAP
jgi:DNA-binding winged helix-turn-helix (wHTH) protein/TolB-like protein